ncbi:hypothetical protein AVEN_50168-1 [Araneus ventricosus]|uniref:Uncharacterized protein n=1 Tax=Araneus ventricosus TaxID=182803 RepID=A0A4Y2ESN2_ARAVE|nr:hypothetical protein AVEN_50168-1 [Araneus ventricosus]
MFIESPLRLPVCQISRLRELISNHLGLKHLHPRYLNDGRCNGSSTEAGVLTAITDHCLTTLEEGALYLQQRGRPNHYCTHVQE